MYVHKGQVDEFIKNPLIVNFELPVLKSIISGYDFETD
jgi:hypothetical protein